MSISDDINNIRTAIYGRDVREAIADGIEQCYTDTTEGKTLAETAAASANTAAATANTAASTANTAASAANAAAQNVGAIVKASPTQPSEAVNQLWIHAGSETEVQIPTYDEFEVVKNTVDAADQIMYTEHYVIDNDDQRECSEDVSTRIPHPYEFISGRTYKLKITIIEGAYQSSTNAIMVDTSSVTNNSVSYLQQNLMRIDGWTISAGVVFVKEFVATGYDKNILIRYKFATGTQHIKVECTTNSTIRDSVSDIESALAAMRSASRMQFGAHRGAEAFAPPNSVAAYEMAGKMGFSWAWIAQIRYSADNTLYVMHDEDVSVTTNGTGNMSELTDEYINTLLCNKLTAYDYSQFTESDLRVPTLEKVIQICLRYGMKMCFRIEPLPNEMTSERQITVWNKLFALIKAYGVTPDEATYSGYSPNEMMLCISNLGNVEICPFVSGYGAQDYVDWYTSNPMFANARKAVLLPSDRTNLDAVKLLHSNEIRVYSFFNGGYPSIEQMNNFASWGVDILQNGRYAMIPIG